MGEILLFEDGVLGCEVAASNVLGATTGAAVGAVDIGTPARSLIRAQVVDTPGFDEGADIFSQPARVQVLMTDHAMLRHGNGRRINPLNCHGHIFSLEERCLFQQYR
ncbi:hypothetical protein [Stenotrophomonas sp. SPM]|uniref:hypothetical protein n=1 Tax=Stenotrophomonas sp. SPM TaxID=2170735 RepID=UPI00140234AA|nr:hypothetical protein [Stenotrophomonas sp. SPM]